MMEQTNRWLVTSFYAAIIAILLILIAAFAFRGDLMEFVIGFFQEQPIVEDDSAAFHVHMNDDHFFNT
ncbi:hypothetical protein [Jeotgalibacillus aurantiacus]|uniref:hypothetical protein n=1 Tax=Jeotgalibacillus aurantiacus TaxID=2763266 RepID=UPI001D0A811F|nr:hypothetical protein [Jeotgalibacillus aurantiacus]